MSTNERNEKDGGRERETTVETAKNMFSFVTLVGWEGKQEKERFCLCFQLTVLILGAFRYQIRRGVIEN